MPFISYVDRGVGTPPASLRPARATLTKNIVELAIEAGWQLRGLYLRRTGLGFTALCAIPPFWSADHNETLSYRQSAIRPCTPALSRR